MSLFCWTQRKMFCWMWETEQFWGTIDLYSIFFPTMEVNCAPKQPGYKLSSKYLSLCSAEQRNLYRFGTTWGWVNDDRIFLFGWTIPLIVRIGPYAKVLGLLRSFGLKSWDCGCCWDQSNPVECLFFVDGASGGSREGTVFLPEEQLSTPYYSQSGGKRTQYQGECLK